MDQYKDIRHLYAVEGLSIRAIAKRLGISRNTVKRYCLGEVLPWEKRPKVERQKKVITEGVREFVKQCFEKDKTAPARPVREANLPEDLRNFSLLLEDPDRSMVKLLRLTVDHGQEKVLAAVRKALELHQFSVDVVAYYTTAGAASPVLPIKGPAVQPVDLTCYDNLLAGGGLS